MNEVNEAIEANVKLYGNCLQKVINFLPSRIKAIGDNDVTIDISNEMYKDIATSIFIETNKQFAAEKSAKEPASDSQKTFISDLLKQKGQKAVEYFQKYLEEHDLENGEQLTKTMASEVITALKDM